MKLDCSTQYLAVPGEKAPSLPEVEPKCQPRLYEFLMKEKGGDASKIGPYTKRSSRNNWAESIEHIVREKSPPHFYATYDVSSVQGTDFHEYTYTEFPAGGVYICTQSREINCRLQDFAAKEESGKAGEEALEKFINAFADKYVLNELPEKYKNIDDIIFLPGHNLLDLADLEIVERIIFEDPEAMIKPHPLTIPDVVQRIAGKMGWDRIIDKDVSGAELLKNCKTVYTTTASEFSITGTALGKNVKNISVFSGEGAGVYLPFARIMTITQRKEGIEAAQRKLGNILACKWSGLIFEFQDDYEERIDAYYKKSQELRELYKPLAQGRGLVDEAKKQKRPPLNLENNKPVA